MIKPRRLTTNTCNIISLNSYTDAIYCNNYSIDTNNAIRERSREDAIDIQGITSSRIVWKISE